MILLDKNRISDPVLARSWLGLVVPERAIYEDVKTNCWKINLERTYSTMRLYMRRIYVAHSVSQLLDIEQKTGKIRNQIIDKVMTDFINNYIRHGITKNIEDSISRYKDSAITTHTLINRYQCSIQSIMNDFENTGVYKTIRHLDCETDELDMLPSIVTIARYILRNHTQYAMIQNSNRLYDIERYSVTYRYLICLLMLVSKLTLGSPKLSMSIDKLANFIIDLDYAVISSYFSTVASDDNFVVKLFCGLRRSNCRGSWLQDILGRVIYDDRPITKVPISKFIPCSIPVDKLDIPQ